MDYVRIDQHRGRAWSDGEVQLFTNYRRRVSAATVARREVLAESAGETVAPDELERRIWDRGTAVRRRGRC